MKVEATLIPWAPISIAVEWLSPKQPFKRLNSLPDSTQI